MQNALAAVNSHSIIPEGPTSQLESPEAHTPPKTIWPDE